MVSRSSEGMKDGKRCARAGDETHLIATGTRPEALVGEVKLLDTERTRLLLVIVDELILDCS